MDEPVSSDSSEFKNINLSFKVPEAWAPQDTHFKDALTQFVTKVNALIATYNTTQDKDEKIAILKEMSGEMQSFDHQFPPGYYEGLTFYSELSSILFREIKNQRRALDKQSMLDADLGPLSELIANMSPDKLNEFAKILTGKEELQTALAALYAPDDQSEEAKQFDSFMNAHTIEVLGGFNSRNFKVINTESGAAEVLKLDNRLGHPKDIEDSLRKNNFTGLAPVNIDRSISCRVIQTHPDLPGQEFSQLLSSIQVTEYCEDGSILQYSGQQKDKGDGALCLSACLVIEEMAKKTSELSDNNVIMLDFKPANWLFKDGKLLLGDTKSFMRCDANGMFSTLNPGNQYYGILTSPQFFFPENESKDEKGNNKEITFSASKFNAYVLGLNLHCFLRGGMRFPFYEKGLMNQPNRENDGYLLDERNAPGWDEPLRLGYPELRYNNDEYGKLIKLVDALTKYSAEDRLSIEEALVRLQAIKSEIPSQAKTNFEDKFKELGLTTFDKIIQSYLDDKFAIDDTKQLINNSGEVNQLSTDLKNNLAEVKQSFNGLFNAQLGDDKHQDFVRDKFKEYLKSSPDGQKEILAEMKELHELYVSCKSLEFGDSDKKMREYTHDQFKEYIGNPDKRAGIILELNKMLAELNANGIMYLRSTAADFRGRDDFFNKGNIQKAENIERLVGSLSPEERGGFLKHDKRDSVLAELARRIGPLGGIGNVPKDKEGKINDKQADESFVCFKKKFIAVKGEDEQSPTKGTDSPKNDPQENDPKHRGMER